MNLNFLFLIYKKNTNNIYLILNNDKYFLINLDLY